MGDADSEKRHANQDEDHPQDAEEPENNGARFEIMLTVPAYIQDRVFSWESEFCMCDRISRIGMAFDVITNLYITVLAHFTRTADVRYRLLEAPSKSMAASVYYCDRVLDSTLNAISAQRRNINKLTEKAISELKKCVELRKSTERSYLEVKRDLVGNNDVVVKWKERVAVLLELETRLKKIKTGGPDMFDSLKKPWSTVVGLQPDGPISGVRQNSSQDVAGTNRGRSDVEHVERNTADDNMAQCTPVHQENLLGEGPVNKDSIEEVDEPNVPETPDVEIRVAFPTQVSSPRNRKRPKLLSPEEDPDGRTLAVPNKRVLSTVRTVQYVRDSPVLASLQAYGDLAHRADVIPAPLPPAVTQPHGQSPKTPDGQNRSNDGSNSGKIMLATPRVSQQEQSQHAAHSTVKENCAEIVQPDHDSVQNDNT